MWPRWIVLVFIPSSWLMGVTAYLTTDLASIPLMWIIPLALYLLSFILAFARSAAGLVRAATLSLPYLIVPLVLVMIAGFVHLFWIPLHLIGVFRRFVGLPRCAGRAAAAAAEFVGVLRHHRPGRTPGWHLERARRSRSSSTGFVEYPLALVLACLAAPGFKTHIDRRTGNDLVVGPAVRGRRVLR